MAPSTDDVACYAVAPIRDRVTINAYIGVPLTRSDGSLFGTLCAVSPDEQPDGITSEQPMIELMARLLSTVLEQDLDAATTERRAQQFEALAMLDELTGLPNRRVGGCAGKRGAALAQVRPSRRGRLHRPRPPQAHQRHRGRNAWRAADADMYRYKARRKATARTG